MIVNKLEPKQSLKKEYLKIKPDRESFAAFQVHLARLIDLCDSQKDEEFNKNLLSDFLKKSFYGDRYFINTKESSDLVIHNDKDVKSTAGVIFETKKPTKTASAEMPKVDNLNTKAVQQLVLYFLRERVTHGNLQVKHLVVTNIYEWFIFDAEIFDRLFYQDKSLVKQFKAFEEKQFSSNKTDVFYKEIAKPAIDKVIDQIKFTHFDLRDLESVDLIDLYKIFSPEHLLKIRSANDSNSLNKPFYNELLYIIGLAETKEGGKKLIGRVKEGDRHDGSLIENAIGRLDSLDKISQLKKTEEFGDTYEEKLFNVALRLSINWINRILFLKLLEAQLIKYHQGDLDSAREFAFLNLEKVRNYADLNSLFFDVLAREQDKREQDVKAVFANVPYLNSSLFEPTETEQQTIDISNLKARSLPIFGATVLIDGNEKKRSGDLNALEYLFEFLHAYKFNKDEFEDGQEDSEKLINAAVLGLIFEKINGYKDGSFYTPSFITMYMCRETIRRAVVQKFNEEMGWNCENIQDLCDNLGSYIKERDRVVRKNEANGIVNSLKICDPAVGSGHFLVSALNEMIAIKQYLGILQDRNGESLSKYEIEVVNDKLKVTLDNKLFAYNPKNKESQRVQEALFHEKQTIIEGCLFGVDINPNSVKICQLRLWIELLKNAYYRVDLPQASIGIDPPQPPLKRGEKSRLKAGENINASFPRFTKGVRGDLETLPNIDINIKCGNSLISRFGLDVDVKQVLQKQKFSIEQYRNAVQTYRGAESKAQKREMESLIAKIKAGFSSSLLAGDPKKVKLRQLQAELYGVENQMLLLEETKAEVKAREKRVSKLNNEIDKLSAEIEDIESGRLYENALEWRFEFPEVLNDDGDFVGFDIVIGNPPYFSLSKIKEQSQTAYFENNYQTYTKCTDIYCLFYEKGACILRKEGFLTYITSNSWLKTIYGDPLKKYIVNNTQPRNLLNIEDIQIFEEATVESNIITLKKDKANESFSVASLTSSYSIGSSLTEYFNQNCFDFKIPITSEWIIGNEKSGKLKQKIEFAGKPLKDFKILINFGVKTGYNEAFIINEQTKDELVSKSPDSIDIIKPILRGRDLKKYSYEFSGMYLLNTHNGVVKTNIERIKVKEDYPLIYDYLDSFMPQVEQRQDKGKHWTNLRNCAYLEDFEKPKIIWGEISDKPKFAFDDSNYYAEATTFLMTGEKLKYLLGILNSKLSEWYFNQISTTTGMGTNRWKKYKIEIFPIKEPTEIEESSLENLVDEILTAKKGDRHADTSELEKAIDRLVYKLYQLTYNEVKIIDPEFSLTEQEYTSIKIE